MTTPRIRRTSARRKALKTLEAADPAAVDIDVPGVVASLQAMLADPKTPVRTRTRIGNALLRFSASSGVEKPAPAPSREEEARICALTLKAWEDAEAAMAISDSFGASVVIGRSTNGVFEAGTMIDGQFVPGAEPASLLPAAESAEEPQK